MKNIIFLFAAFLLSTATFAKKVKFSVDMTGHAVSANGVHVIGDFQTLAGFSGGDWVANTTLLTKEGSTNIYSTIVTIPAHHVYQYKYVNGDQTYETEFVPDESRVGTVDNIDNRWLYVDSMANDTTNIGAVLFAGNAPSGLSLVRFRVDLRNNQPSSTTGSHVAGSFQGNDPAKTMLYSFADSVYEYIAYVTNSTYSFKYYSGNTAATTETVPIACATNNLRSVAVTKDTVLPIVCFSSCSACGTTAVANTKSLSKEIKMYPNPATDRTTIEFNYQDKQHHISLIDQSGRLLRSYNNYTQSTLELDRRGLANGVYFINIINSKGQATAAKLILQ